MKIAPLIFVCSFLFLLFNSAALHAQKKQRGVTSITDDKGNVSTGKMKKKKKTGQWRTESKRGVLVSTENYVKGKLEGQQVLFGWKGDTIGVNTYHNDTLNGPSYSSPRTNVREEGNYVNGKKEGWWVKRDKGFNNSIDSMYYVNGQIQGARKVYGDNVLWQVEYYKDGVKHGGDTTYAYKSGYLQKISQWSNGQKNGPYREYSPLGEVSRKKVFRNDTIIEYDSAWMMNNGQLRLYEVSHYNNAGTKTYSASYNQGRVEYARYSGDDGLMDSLYQYYQGTLFRTCYYDQTLSTDRKRESTYHEWRFDFKGRKESHGDIKQNYRSGKWTWFDTTGRVTKEIVYLGLTIPGKYTCYHPNGKVKITGACRQGYLSDSIHVYTPAGKEIKEGSPLYKQTLTDHFKTEQEVRYRGRREIEEIELILGEVTQDGDDEVGVIGSVTQSEPMVQEEADQVFMFAEQMPSFPGDSMQTWLKHNLVFPEAEKEQGKSGTVYVKFVVLKDGTVSDVVVLRGVPGAPGFSTEALRVVNAMPKWIPGQMNGRSVICSMTIPIRFAL